MDKNKKLYLSSTDKKLSGVCGGIGEYFGIDPTLIRLAYVILGFTYGSGLLLYIIMAAIIPKNPYQV